MADELVVYEFQARVDDAVANLTRLQKSWDSISSKVTVSSVKNAFNSASKYANRASGYFRHLSRELSNVHRNTSLVSKAMQALVGVKLGQWLAESTKSAIDYTETLNLFTVAMKDSIDTANEFVDTVSEMYGLDPKWLMDATGMFYEMAYAVNMPDKAARKLSTSLTALSVDLSSLFNVDAKTVSDNITSGIRGMSRAVVKYGMDVRATTVEQYALTLGITENYETMNEASREILRYLVMVKQARDATGDFAKTIESPANQLRVLKDQIVQVGRAIGNIVLNYLAPMLSVINGIVMAIKVMIQVFSALLGISYDASGITSGLAGGASSADDLASGIGAAGSAADKTKKKIQNMLAPFDELNIIQENDVSGAAGGGAGGAGGVSWGEVDPKLLAALDATQYKLEEVRMKALDVRDAILEFFGITPDGDSWVYSPDLFEKNLKEKFPQWEKTITALFDVDYSEIKTQLGNIWGTLKEIAGLTFGVIADDFERMFGVTPDEALSSFITNLPQNLASINEWLQANKETIAAVLARVLELYVAWRVFLTAAPLLAAAFGAVSTALGVLGSIFGAFSALVAPIAATFAGVKAAILAFAGAVATTSGGIGALTGQLALAGTTSSTLTGTVAALATQFAGPLAAAITAVQAVGAALFVGGFIEWAASSEEFQAIMQRVWETIGSIFTHFGELFNAVKDSFVAGCNFMAENFGFVYEAIANIISQLLVAFDNIIVFLTGVFQGDWKKAFAALGNIFISALNILGSAGAAIANALIKIINSAVDLIINGVIGAINSLIDGIAGVLSFVGIDLSVRIPEVPEIPPVVYTPIPTVPFATGGVVTGPTNALIGEGKYNEAVIPLGNSPQLKAMLQQFAEISAKVLTNGATGTSTTNGMNTPMSGGSGNDTWGNFETSMLSSFNEHFSSMESDKFSYASYQMLSKLNESLTATTEDTDWVSTGNAIRDALLSLDWETTLSPVADKIATTLKSLVEPKVESIVSSISASVNSALSSAVGGGGGGDKGYGKFDGVAMPPVLSNPKKFWSSNPSYKGWSNKMKDGHFTFGAPMATGGVVTSPTRAFIGEGLYDEAVIPLGNSPQMLDLLNKFAEVSANSRNSEPVEVRVFIGDKEWDAFTYESVERGRDLVGASVYKERS